MCNCEQYLKSNWSKFAPIETPDFETENRFCNRLLTTVLSWCITILKWSQIVKFQINCKTVYVKVRSHRTHITDCSKGPVQPEKALSVWRNPFDLRNACYLAAHGVMIQPKLFHQILDLLFHCDSTLPVRNLILPILDSFIATLKKTLRCLLVFQL